MTLLTASPIGVPISNFRLEVKTVSLPVPFIVDAISLYEPLIHTIGTQSQLIPIDSRISPATLTTALHTAGDVRTLKYRLAAQNEAALADPSVYSDLQSGVIGSLGIRFDPFNTYDDPDRIEFPHELQFYSRLYGITGEILATHHSTIAAESRSFTGWSTAITASNTFDGIFNEGPRGVPSSIEMWYSYKIVPEPTTLFCVVSGFVLLSVRNINTTA